MREILICVCVAVFQVLFCCMNLTLDSSVGSRSISVKALRPVAYTVKFDNAEDVDRFFDATESVVGSELEGREETRTRLWAVISGTYWESFGTRIERELAKQGVTFSTAE